MSPPAPGHRIPLRLPSRQAKAPLPSSSRHRTGRRAGSSDPPGRTMMRLTVPEDRPQKSCGSAPASHWLSALPASRWQAAVHSRPPPSSPARTSGPKACAKSIRPAVHPFPFLLQSPRCPRYRRLWQTRCSAFLSSVSSANSSVFLFCVLPFLTFSISVFSILTHDFPVLGNSVRCSTKILFQKLLEECFS